ncbi:SDR family oxidoreductase [Cognataquiflexum rubidum]|uniref:SDR family oxidoreductase n=1 Tax=Cognataquiflexum rubidum TaxID=2922273 RepID=UPI001F143741|nr:SDR family oxidoreductase [Cognataquiflexum rubidum]MCH6236759.1 SDR family oxidoreductase [Cognataquiflexum rubidum]
MSIDSGLKKTVLVTGANGLLGQKLIGFLRNDAGVDLIGTGKGASRLPETWNRSYTWQELDITDRVQVMEVFAATKPDTVIHAAAMTQVDDCEKDREGCRILNVEAVRYLIEACEIHNTHLIHLSTDFIFDGEDGPYTEEALPNPVNYYGVTKMEAENLLFASKVRWAIVRTVLVYGIAQDMSRSNIILWVKKSLEEGKTIKVVNDQWRTPTLAEDLAEGCILIMKKGATGVFNISGADFLTPYDMAIQTTEYFGLDKNLITESDSTLFTQPAKRPPRTGFIIDKAKKELGYSPKSFLAGIGILAKQLKLADS